MQNKALDKVGEKPVEKTQKRGESERYSDHDRREANRLRARRPVHVPDLSPRLLKKLFNTGPHKIDSMLMIIAEDMGERK